jgi:BirA family transcriptional regulator, biotin operon repressor / biotin---[acetyl-CoA-carboxylase] ligase
MNHRDRSGRIDWHSSVDSTQDLAHQAALAGAPAGTAVAARQQTGGRGTRRRPWAAPEGGLWISIVVRPALTDHVELLGIRAGLALADRLEQESAGRLDLRLKWPTDLYAADGKLGGVLAEARWQGDVLGWVVVGIGLNLTNELPTAIAPRATRTADFGWSPRPESLAPTVVEAVLGAAELTGGLQPGELARFEARDWLAGRRTRRPVAGRIDGLTPEGRLVIRPDRGPLVQLLDSSELELER